MKPFASPALRGMRHSGLRLSSRVDRTCSSCRAHSLTRRWVTSESSPKTEKPYYITTPIFYVNSSPHIGHLYTIVLADVLKRWQLINGKNAIMCTGTDEHGMKIQRAAAKEDMEPKDFCDLNSSKFRELATAANIDHDFFIRTTDDQHKEAVKNFWLQLKHGLPETLGLYKGTHKGWYCVSDECFYPGSMVEVSYVPQTGRKCHINSETGNEVEWIEEETWFFPLSKYKKQLLEFYDANPEWITPPNRMSEARNWVENHLEDLSITRPASRLSWGIPAPEDDKQTIYVWVDALINYITVAGYGTNWHLPQENMGPWPADVHVIGKDILRFHGVYWPALLMALGLPLPKKILCHNHWTMSNRKMSKSLGNVVNPFFALQRWDVDPLRYFMMASGTLSKDMSYSNQLISVKYAKDLQANIGNLLSRIAKPKATARWSISEAVETFRSGIFEKLAASRNHPLAPAAFFTLEERLANTTPAFIDAMNECDIARAVRQIYELSRDCNRFLSDTRPWILVRHEAREVRVALNWIIYRSAEALRIAGILLQPIMPTKAKALLDELGVPEDRRSVEFARLGADADYGAEALSTDERPKSWDTLFPPTPDGEMSDEALKEKLRNLFLQKTRNKMNQMVELLEMESRLGEKAMEELLASAAAKLEPSQDGKGEVESEAEKKAIS